MKTNYINSLFFLVFLLIISISNSQNILTNGDFSLTTNIDSNFNGPPPANVWSTWQGVNVAANLVVVNGKFSCQIIKPGNQAYEVQLIQAGFHLLPGHSYKLSFDVKADSNCTFGVFLGEYDGNWTSLLGFNNYEQKATTEWRNISIEFDVYTVFPYHKLSFELGTINTNITFDNVRLIDLGVKEQDVSSELNSLNDKISIPAYRPKSYFSNGFINSFKQSKFIIYPTITRTIDTITWSKLLSEEFAQNLKRDENLNIILDENSLNPGELMGKNQHEFFTYDMVRLGNEIKMKRENTDYFIIPEIIFEPERNGTYFVFGIHIFILNNEGENVFSFLLNSHHELFNEAKLYAYSPNENDLDEIKQRCIKVGLKAFRLILMHENQGIKEIPDQLIGSWVMDQPGEGQIPSQILRWEFKKTSSNNGECEFYWLFKRQDDLKYITVAVLVSDFTVVNNTIRTSLTKVGSMQKEPMKMEFYDEVKWHYPGDSFFEMKDNKEGILSFKIKDNVLTFYEDHNKDGDYEDEGEVQKYFREEKDF